MIELVLGLAVLGGTIGGGFGLMWFMGNAPRRHGVTVNVTVNRGEGMDDLARAKTEEARLNAEKTRQEIAARARLHATPVEPAWYDRPGKAVERR